MRYVVLALALCGTAHAQTAAMYRTVAADGTVTFSDVPMSDSSEMITVLVRSGAGRDAARPRGRQWRDRAGHGAVAAGNAVIDHRRRDAFLAAVFVFGDELVDEGNHVTFVLFVGEFLFESSHENVEGPGHTLG